MTIPDMWLAGAGAAALLVAFAIAAGLDVRTREVPDTLWLLLGLFGTALGVAGSWGDGWVPVLLWLVAGGFVLEHLVPWDQWIPSDRGADLIEIGVYGVVLAGVGLAAIRLGLGPTEVPAGVVAVVLTVLFARGLFEAGVLFGGADAKAVMVAGLVVPFFTTPILGVPSGAGPITSVLPFAVNLLLDAALLSIAAPLALALLNARRKEFHLRDGFTTFTIPVAELPHRWVWVRDPDVPVDRAEEDAIETSDEDRAWRVRIAQELERRGTQRVRVGPQLPFLVFLLAGAVAAVLVGNLVFDLILLV